MKSDYKSLAALGCFIIGMTVFAQLSLFALHPKTAEAKWWDFGWLRRAMFSRAEGPGDCTGSDNPYWNPDQQRCQQYSPSYDWGACPDGTSSPGAACQDTSGGTNRGVTAPPRSSSGQPTNQNTRSTERVLAPSDPVRESAPAENRVAAPIRNRNTNSGSVNTRQTDRTVMDEGVCLGGNCDTVEVPDAHPSCYNNRGIPVPCGSDGDSGKPAVSCPYGQIPNYSGNGSCQTCPEAAKGYVDNCPGKGGQGPKPGHEMIIYDWWRGSGDRQPPKPCYKRGMPVRCDSDGDNGDAGQDAQPYKFPAGFSQCPDGQVDNGGSRSGVPGCVPCPPGTEKVFINGGEACKPIGTASRLPVVTNPTGQPVRITLQPGQCLNYLDQVVSCSIEAPFSDPTVRCRGPHSTVTWAFGSRPGFSTECCSTGGATTIGRLAGSNVTKMCGSEVVLHSPYVGGGAADPNPRCYDNRGMPVRCGSTGGGGGGSTSGGYFDNYTLQPGQCLNSNREVIACDILTPFLDPKVMCAGPFYRFTGTVRFGIVSANCCSRERTSITGDYPGSNLERTCGGVVHGVTVPGQSGSNSGAGSGSTNPNNPANKIPTPASGPAPITGSGSSQPGEHGCGGQYWNPDWNNGQGRCQDYAKTYNWAACPQGVNSTNPACVNKGGFGQATNPNNPSNKIPPITGGTGNNNTGGGSSGGVTVRPVVVGGVKDFSEAVHEYATKTAIDAGGQYILVAGGDGGGSFCAKNINTGEQKGRCFGHQEFSMWTDKPGEIVYKSGDGLNLYNVNTGADRNIYRGSVGDLGGEGDCSRGLCVIRDSVGGSNLKCIDLNTGNVALQVSGQGGDNAHCSQDSRYGTVIYERGGSAVCLYAGSGTVGCAKGIGAHGDVAFTGNGETRWAYATYNDKASPCGKDNGVGVIDIAGGNKKVCAGRGPWGIVAHVSGNAPGELAYSYTKGTNGVIDICNIDGSGCKRVFDQQIYPPGDAASSRDYWRTIRASLSTDGRYVVYDASNGGASHTYTISLSGGSSGANDSSSSYQLVESGLKNLSPGTKFRLWQDSGIKPEAVCRSGAAVLEQRAADSSVLYHCQ